MKTTTAMKSALKPSTEAGVAAEGMVHRDPSMIEAAERATVSVIDERVVARECVSIAGDAAIIERVPVAINGRVAVNESIAVDERLAVRNIRVVIEQDRAMSQSNPQWCQPQPNPP